MVLQSMAIRTLWPTMPVALPLDDIEGAPGPVGEICQSGAACTPTSTSRNRCCKEG